jgi:hypothetical protein
MQGPFSVHRRRIAACTTRKGDFALPLQSHDGEAFALPSTPSTNRPPVGCRQGFRALNHEQGHEDCHLHLHRTMAKRCVRLIDNSECGLSNQPLPKKAELCFHYRLSYVAA